MSILVVLATLTGSSRLILVVLATLMGSSWLILVVLATLTGSSRLILFGLGNQKKLVPPGISWFSWVTRRNWFLQVNPGCAG